MKRLYDLANLILLALIAQAYASHARWPGRVPVHFDAAGRPDRWSDRSGLLALAITALGTTAALYLIGWLTPRLGTNPRYLSIPRKREFLALPEEKRELYWDAYKDFFAALAVAINLIFYLILRGMLRIATGAASLLPLGAMLPAFGLLALVLVYYAWRLIVLPGKLIRGDE